MDKKIASSEMRVWMSAKSSQLTASPVGKEKFMTDTGERGGIRERIVDDYAGHKLYDERGEKVGKVEYTVLDTEGRPEYLAVKTGWFGSNTTLIPEGLLRPGEQDKEFEIQASEDRIKDAPTFDNEEDVDRDFESRVREYFGLGGAASGSRTGDSTDHRDDESRQRSESRDDRNLDSHDRDSESRGRDDRDRDDRDRDVRSESRDDHDRDPRDRSSSSDTRDAAVAGGAAGAASGSIARDSDRDDRSSSGSASSSGGRERVKVTVKRERARAERVRGEDGQEEVRIRKEMVEEEEMIEVEDRL